MQAYQVFTGIFIFAVTAGVFLYIGVATYFYRTNVIGKEEVGELEKKPQSSEEAREAKILQPLPKQHPVSSEKEKRRLADEQEESPGLFDTSLVFIEESTEKEIQEDLSSQLPLFESFSSSAEYSEKEKPLEPKKLYL